MRPATSTAQPHTGRPQEIRKNLLRIRQGVGRNLALCSSSTKPAARKGEEIMATIVVPPEVKVWKIGDNQAANVRSMNNYTANTPNGYNLFCTMNGMFATYVKETAGVNLGYKRAGDRKTHFRLPDGQERDIRSGELVALGIGGKPSFLRYAHRTVGINLEYVSNPVYEWRIFGDGELGTPIRENTPVALVNDKVEPDPDFLIHYERPGADFGWTSTPSVWGTIFDWALKVVVELARKAIGQL
jgi:hypothetical protein